MLKFLQNWWVCAFPFALLAPFACAPKADKPLRFNFLKIECPSGKGVEAIFHDGSIGEWYDLQIGSESAKFRPAADCWAKIRPLPSNYDKGDKLRFLDATGSAK